MKLLVNQENKISKHGRDIIKCEGCGFKYYEGDAHKCETSIDHKYTGVANVDEKVKEIEDIRDTETEVRKNDNTRNRKKPLKIKW